MADLPPDPWFMRPDPWAESDPWSSNRPAAPSSVSSAGGKGEGKGQQTMGAPRTGKGGKGQIAPDDDDWNGNTTNNAWGAFKGTAAAAADPGRNGASPYGYARGGGPWDSYVPRGPGKGGPAGDAMRGGRGRGGHGNKIGSHGFEDGNGSGPGFGHGRPWDDTPPPPRPKSERTREENPNKVSMGRGMGSVRPGHVAGTGHASLQYAQKVKEEEELMEEDSNARAREAKLAAYLRNWSEGAPYDPARPHLTPQMEVYAVQNIETEQMQCRKGEPLLLLAFTQDAAYVESFDPGPRQCAYQCGWVWLEQLKMEPHEYHEFLVSFDVSPERRSGITAATKASPFLPRYPMVLQIEEKSAIAEWNMKCESFFPRNCVLPGDFITWVNEQDSIDVVGGFKRMQRKKSGTCHLRILRAGASLWYCLASDEQRREGLRGYVRQGLKEPEETTAVGRDAGRGFQAVGLETSAERNFTVGFDIHELVQNGDSGHAAAESQRAPAASDVPSFGRWNDHQWHPPSWDGSSSFSSGPPRSMPVVTGGFPAVPPPLAWHGDSRPTLDSAMEPDRSQTYQQAPQAPQWSSHAYDFQ